MKQVRQFIAEDAKRLGAQLGDFEGNVATESASIRKDKEQRQFPVFIRSGGGVFTVGQAVISDTTPAGYAINIAPPKDGLPGFLTMINRQNTITVVPTKGKLNLASSLAMGPTLKIIYFDGADWWTF